MVQQLKDLITQSNPAYVVEFEEAHLMNVKADNYKLGTNFAYIEEYLQGKYLKENYQNKKSVQFQIYFCKFTELDNTADEREILRNAIESEIVLPFIDNIRASGLIDRNAEIPFYHPVPRFDAHEVSVMVQIDVKKIIC
jgi:hypothetical protein